MTFGLLDHIALWSLLSSRGTSCSLHHPGPYCEKKNPYVLLPLWAFWSSIRFLPEHVVVFQAGFGPTCVTRLTPCQGTRWHVVSWYVSAFPLSVLCPLCPLSGIVLRDERRHVLTCDKQFCDWWSALMESQLDHQTVISPVSQRESCWQSDADSLTRSTVCWLY